MSTASHSTGASTPDLSPHIKSIVTHVETVTRTIVMAVNHRMFDLNTTIALEYVDPLFSAAPMPPWDAAPLDLKGWREYMTQVTNECPEYEIKVLGLETNVNERVGIADVFMNFEVKGIPPGVVRQSVGRVKFRKGDGKWRMFGYEGVDGIAGTEGGL